MPKWCLNLSKANMMLQNVPTQIFNIKIREYLSTDLMSRRQNLFTFHLPFIFKKIQRKSEEISQIPCRIASTKRMSLKEDYSYSPRD